MGIKNLNTLIKKCPNAVYQIPLNHFKGQRIAIDANNIMIIALTPIWRKIVHKTEYPHRSPDMDTFHRELIGAIKRQIERLIMSGIVPVYVFDGASPIEKQQCRDQRHDDRDKVELEFQSLIEQMSNYPPNQVPQHMLDSTRKAASKLWPYTTDIFKSIVTSIGLPVIQGANDNILGCEAERICVNLCLEGYCSATLSTDTDSLAHGCPLLINKFLGYMSEDNSINHQEMVQVIDLKKLLIDLNLSFESFRDVCIMSGCDYNNNIKGVGPVKSWNLIKKHKTIDNLPDNYDISILNHHRSRELFAKAPLEEMVESKIIPKLVVDESYLMEMAPNTLSQYQMEGWIATLITIYKMLPEIPEKSDIKSYPEIIPSDQDNGLMLIIE